MQLYGLQKVWCWVLAIFAALALAGCAGSALPGEEFIGAWAPKDPELSMYRFVVTRDAADAQSGDKAVNFVVRVYVQEPSQPATEIDNGNAVLDTGVLKVYSEGKLMGEMTVDATRNSAVYLQAWSNERLDVVRVAMP